MTHHRDAHCSGVARRVERPPANGARRNRAAGQRAVRAHHVRVRMGPIVNVVLLLLHSRNGRAFAGLAAMAAARGLLRLLLLLLRKALRSCCCSNGPPGPSRRARRAAHWGFWPPVSPPPLGRAARRRGGRPCAVRPRSSGLSAARSTLRGRVPGERGEHALGLLGRSQGVWVAFENGVDLRLSHPRPHLDAKLDSGRKGLFRRLGAVLLCEFLKVLLGVRSNLNHCPSRDLRKLTIGWISACDPVAIANRARDCIAPKTPQAGQPLVKRARGEEWGRGRPREVRSGTAKQRPPLVGTTEVQSPALGQPRHEPRSRRHAPQRAKGRNRRSLPPASRAPAVRRPSAARVRARATERYLIAES